MKKIHKNFQIYLKIQYHSLPELYLQSTYVNIASYSKTIRGYSYEKILFI